MNKSPFVLSALSALLVLAACQPGGGKYNPSDARTFWLTGDVKEVRLARVVVSDDAGATEDRPWYSQDELEMSFDAAGRVTLDPFGDPYEYDADGVFVRGYNDKTVLERDAKGRLLEYNNATLDEDSDYDELNIEEVFHVTFGYDGQGRAVTRELGGWEWMSTYTYVFDGNNAYPSSATYETFEEGFVEEGTQTFTYTSFDDRGNWTERTVHDVSRMYEEGFEDEVEITDITYTERCTYTYWSDKK